MLDLGSLKGEWEAIPEESDEVGRFGAGRMTIEIENNELTLRRVAAGAKLIDTIVCGLDGTNRTGRPNQRIVPELFCLGIYRDLDNHRTITGACDEKSVTIREEVSVTVSQGKKNVTIEYSLVPEESADKLRLTVRRSSLPGNTTVSYAFKRSDVRSACYMELGDDWSIDGDLSKHAMLISLQALANRKGPELYFVYPAAWDFKFTPNVLDYLKEEKHIKFEKLTHLELALSRYAERARGYVVWDRACRTSLIVAFTIAGVEDSLVVSNAEIDLAESAGLRCVADLRGIFSGKSDLEIYRWAYDNYWERCSRDFIVWLGGEHGKIMRPGIADWGMYKRAFFTDLSARETDADEYSMARKLLGEQNPGSYVFGWHSYKKDTEDEHVTLTSSFGLKVEGLHTLPNMSFSSQIPVSDGFEFRNNHNVNASYRRAPEKKVYLACVQTDCLGIGAWTEPGRGEIPYAWEVTMNWVWLAPAMMEFFYKQATPQDYFIGALSGPGYMYPSAVPPELLPGLIEEAKQLMNRLDLRVFDIMDFSKLLQPGGTPDLDKKLVDAYYDGMPEAIGFVNGYYPAQTFTVRDDRPFISFDYYLSPTRSEADAVNDLVELATVNEDRPYFLLMHVRNFSDIRRVIRIIDALPEEFESIALDEFLVMAGRNWNFAEWYAR